MPRHGRVLHDGRSVWVVQLRGELVPLAGPPWVDPEPARDAKALDPAAVSWLPPTVPSKIVCVGRNYAEHAREHGAEVPQQPLLFLKAPSALLAGGADVELPPESARVEFEGEMAVVIGRRARRLRPGESGAVFGWLTADDVTARDLQRADGQWSRAKSFDTFCPVSRLVSTEPPPRDAVLETTVGGEVRQRGRLEDMTFQVDVLLAHVTAAMTLEPGDLVLTGTPAGVGPLAPGDRVLVSVTGLPELEHGVRAECLR